MTHALSLVLALLAGEPALAEPAPALGMRDGLSIPSGAAGVVLVDDLSAASLLHLNGMAGGGRAALRPAHGEDCVIMPLRFAAGGFDGEGVGLRRAVPVLLVIRAPRVAEALAHGVEVTSDALTVSHDPADVEADVLVVSGLNEGHGFVLNPGETVLADLFGASASRVSCAPRG